tara:strand:+ start:1372 stop:3231 length:1860 start_codon:yes stop_codon:yes gene_type:complete
MTNQSIPTTYLPLEKFHIVPVKSLSPSELKVSAKRTNRDREKISHTTKLNAIAKYLGIKGGFANYEREYRESIIPFMESYNLKRYKNLVEHSKPGDYKLYFPFSRQDVSERLFYGDNTPPKKLFTGHNFDFTGVLGWHSIDLYEVLQSDPDWCEIIINNYHVKRSANKDFDCTLLPERQQYLLELDVETTITLTSIDKGARGNFEHQRELNQTAVKAENQVSVRIIDLILLQNRGSSSCTHHLLGNTLTESPEHTGQIKLYAPKSMNKEKFNEDFKSDCYLQQLQTKRFRESDLGWVTVIPYNQNLIFVYDGHGNYDFFIKNQRDKEFNHQLFGSKLKRADIPSFIEDYRFERWDYFEYQGHRESDNHLAEQHFYNTGGSQGNYPGNRTILRKYYQDKGIYHPQHRTTNIRSNDFNHVVVDGKEMMISELITIRELIDFLNKNEDYVNYRQGDSLGPTNSDKDLDLPASCTFFDVLSYINWLENKSKLPLRLLSYEEYKSLRNNEFSNPNRGQGSDMNFFKPTGEKYASHPPYMAQNDFDNLHLRFPSPLNKASTNSLQFVDSDYFCEWLLEGVQIRSASLTSFYMDEYVLRSGGPQDSTGKYKGMKTGFRLCYELAKH